MVLSHAEIGRFKKSKGSIIINVLTAILTLVNYIIRVKK